MFNPSVEDLWLEVDKAIAATQDHIEGSASIVRRMTGRYYTKTNEETASDPENHHFAYLANMLPTLGEAGPKVRVKAQRIVGHAKISRAMEDGVNSWIRDQKDLRFLEPVKVDFLLSRGIVLHRLDAETRSGRGVVTPHAERISPRQFFIDSMADSPEKDEFRGHWFYADVEDLKADPDINPDFLEKIAPEDSDGNEAPEIFEKPTGTELGRERVKLYCVWLRKTNTIRTLCKLNEAMEVYAPEPYYGPQTGPYVLFDAYPVPDQTWPLPPMVAVEDQVQDLNTHARAMGRSAERRRSIGLVEASNPDLGKKLTEAEDGEILPASGITGNHVTVEVGGVTDQQYKITEYLRVRLDRISGLTATAQGNVGEANTASEAQIAQAALSKRVKYLMNHFAAAADEMLWGIGWFMFNTEGIVIPVNSMDPYTFQPQEGLFFGGPFRSDMGATWEDFGLEIKVNSFQKQVDYQQRFIAFYEQFMKLMAIAPTMPWIRVMLVLRDLASALDLEDVYEDWVIPQLFGSPGTPPMTPPSQVIGGIPTPQQRGLPGLPRGSSQEVPPAALPGEASPLALPTQQADPRLSPFGVAPAGRSMGGASGGRASGGRTSGGGGYRQTKAGAGGGQQRVA